MPYWILKCPQCKKDFIHSEINMDKEPYGLWALPSKPGFPEGGSWLKCAAINITVQIRVYVHVRNLGAF